MNSIPLSLYIHLPWCIRKCPYCDFNSHQLRSSIPETEYVDALIADLKQDLKLLSTPRSLGSIFFGGGTPSLFSAASIDRLLTEIAKLIQFDSQIEITLEANPGAVEQERFKGYRQAGVNRLSLGVQSFSDKHLKLLGRIHDASAASKAYDTALRAGFNNINIDLMYGLPDQTVADALADLTTAIDLAPSHLSWYQLTLEPNTVFSKFPPTLPDENILEEQELVGKILLADNGFRQYEVSAYCQTKHECQHNLNYWLFGDYLGIGAGAHSKLTDHRTLSVTRINKLRQPKDYLSVEKPFIAEQKVICPTELTFEFMLNALRLNQTIPINLFEERTGNKFDTIIPTLIKAKEREFIDYDEEKFTVTSLGRQFLNDLTAMFLPDSKNQN